MCRSIIYTLLVFSSLTVLYSQNSEQAIYKDGHGGFVYMPNGDISFADVLVDYVEGNPSAPVNGGHSKIVLGKPDYNIETRKGFFSMGCGGSITVRFTDNALTDIEGPDLYVFEVGSEIEETQLEISKDGSTWINVGKISGGRAEVDIHDFVKKDEIFYYVKLTDLQSRCKGSWPGADIDAIAAIGSVMQVNLNAALLFDVGSYTLKPGALSSLDSLSTRLNETSIRSIDITGHTDNVGSDENNLILSKNRANAVKEYLQKKITDKIIAFNITGLGETQPVANNETEEGRQANRRVSMVVYPKQVNKVERKNYEEFTNVLFIPFNIAQASWFNDFPRAINAKNFAGLPTDHIDDALFYNGTTYFFYGNKLKKYNHSTKKIETGEFLIKDVFPGITFTRIDASIYLPDKSALCFIKDDSCAVYHPANKSVKQYSLQALFPGLKTQKPEAILFMGDGYFTFFFDGYTQTFDYFNKIANEPSLMTNANWGNIWLDGPDAIMDDNSGMIYFFHNPE